MLMIYSNILLLLIFVFGILTHDTLLRPSTHRQHDHTKESQFLNAAEQDDPLPLSTKALSSATRTVNSSIIPLASQLGLNQPNYKKAIAYEITHLLLVLLQYKNVAVRSCSVTRTSQVEPSRNYGGHLHFWELEDQCSTRYLHFLPLAKDRRPSNQLGPRR